MAIRTFLLSFSRLSQFIFYSFSMKTLFALSLSLLLSCSLFAQITVDGTTTPPPPAPITWDATVHDFGKVPQGKPVTFRYEFTNNGDTPLKLATVKAGCGCTTPTWSQEAIAPHKKGYVEATFNAATAGMFGKSVTVTPEGFQAIVLSLNGEVVTQ